MADFTGDDEQLGSLFDKALSPLRASGIDPEEARLNPAATLGLGMHPEIPDAPMPQGAAPTAPSIASATSTTPPNFTGSSLEPSRAPSLPTPPPAHVGPPLTPMQPRRSVGSAVLRAALNAGLGAGTSVQPPLVQSAITHPSSAISRIKNPFLRDVARVGDIAGTIAAPGAMRWIPGTTLNAEQKFANNLMRQRASIGMGQAQGNLALTQQKVAAETPRPVTQQEADSMGDPSLAGAMATPGQIGTMIENRQKSSKPQVVPTNQGDVMVTPGNAAAVPITLNGKTVMPVSKSGSLRPATIAGANGKPQLVNFDPQRGVYLDPGTGSVIPNAQPYIKPGSSQHITVMRNGQPHVMGEDAQGNFTRDLGIAPPSFAETGLWRPTEGIDQRTGNQVAGQFNERTGQSVATNGDAMTPVPTDVMGELNKELQTARETSKRLQIMKENEKDALRGDQQAMVSLVSNHVGMTIGAQKGGRINQAMYDEAMQSAPILSRIGARFDKNGLLSGVTLTPEQIQQMVALGNVVNNNQWNQLRQTYQQYGIPMPGNVGPAASQSANPLIHAGNGKTIGVAAMRAYLSAHGNDAAAARKSIIADGWKLPK